MLAVTIVEKMLVTAERPDPQPGAGEILVKVRAAGLNNADLAQVRGGYPAPAGSPADIPGLEIAGEVVAVGPAAVRFAVGDRVMAVVGGGGQAELCVVHERCAMPIPAGVSWEAAGGFPEVFTTAHDAIFTQCHLAMGERLCVHGAAGGVGVAAVQLAVAAGASVVATVRDEARRGDVEQLGATVVAPDSFEAQGPFDVIIELVGAHNLKANIAALNTGGRITVIGVGGSGAVGEINLMRLMQKRASIMGSTLRARPLEAKADAARRVESQVLPHLASGRLQVPVWATYPMAEADVAYERFAAGGKFGKIVLVNG